MTTTSATPTLAGQVSADLFTNLTTVIRGKAPQLRLTVAVLLSGGHLLLEDVPGVGKTMLAKTLARSIAGTFRRIQGTPDLLPADLTGVSVYKRSTETWEFRPGPLFANVVLVDEINRTTPRTQSALLEAMEEHQVSVDGATRVLPDPFFVIATQNPYEHAGTFPLVEGQRDRFAAVLEMGLPPRAAEKELLNGVGGTDALDQLRPVTNQDSLAAAIHAVDQVHAGPPVVEYILDIVEASRTHDDVALGGSPRASLSMQRLAKSWAVVAGRDYVTADDVQAVAESALAHRLILPGGADLKAARRIMADIVAGVAVPA